MAQLPQKRRHEPEQDARQNWVPTLIVRRGKDKRIKLDNGLRSSNVSGRLDQGSPICVYSDQRLEVAHALQTWRYVHLACDFGAKDNDIRFYEKQDVTLVGLGVEVVQSHA